MICQAISIWKLILIDAEAPSRLLFCFLSQVQASSTRCPCQNGGVCVILDAEATEAAIACECKPGSTGEGASGVFAVFREGSRAFE